MDNREQTAPVQCENTRRNTIDELLAGMEMSKSDFWELIAGAKKECGQNMGSSINWLTSQLIARGPQQTQDFHDILNGYMSLSYQYGLWTAASLMCENGCSDDSFIDFRAWLIAQGEEIYLAALADPDSLADVEAYGGCQFEELLYTGNETMKHLTGKDAYDNTDPDAYKALVEELKKDIVYGEGVNYPYEWDEIEARFPRLCEKHLEPDTVEFHLKHQHTIWFSDCPDIQKAREGGPPQRNGPQTDIKMEGM